MVINLELIPLVLDCIEITLVQFFHIVSGVSITGTNASPGYYYFFYDIEMRQLSIPTNYSICSGDSLIIGNSVYHTSGSYVDTLQSIIGCDSMVYSNLPLFFGY